MFLDSEDPTNQLSRRRQLVFRELILSLLHHFSLLTLDI